MQEYMREPYQSGNTGTGPGSSGCTGFGFGFGWTWLPNFGFGSGTRWTWLPNFGFGSGTGYLHVEKTGLGYGNGFGFPKWFPCPGLVVALKRKMDSRISLRKHKVYAIIDMEFRGKAT